MHGLNPPPTTNYGIALRRVAVWSLMALLSVVLMELVFPYFTPLGHIRSHWTIRRIENEITAGSDLRKWRNFLTRVGENNQWAEMGEADPDVSVHADFGGVFEPLRPKRITMRRDEVQVAFGGGVAGNVGVIVVRDSNQPVPTGWRVIKPIDDRMYLFRSK